MYRFCLLGVIAIALTSDMAIGQIYVQNGVVVSGGGSFDESGDIRIANLLTDPSVINQIEMVDYQKRDIQNLIQIFGSANVLANEEYLGRLRNAETQADRDAALKTLQNESRLNRMVNEEKIRGQLLPHQLRALGNIVFQKQLRVSGMEGIFSSPIGMSLGLTDEEKEDLKRKAKVVSERLKKEIWALKKKAALELINELPERMREKFADEFGLDDDEPEFQPDQGKSLFSSKK